MVLLCKKGKMTNSTVCYGVCRVCDRKPTALWMKCGKRREREREGLTQYLNVWRPAEEQEENVHRPIFAFRAASSLFSRTERLRSPDTTYQNSLPVIPSILLFRKEVCSTCVHACTMQIFPFQTLPPGHLSPIYSTFASVALISRT